MKSQSKFIEERVVIFALLICSGIFGQSYDCVKIFPEKGFLFNNDSVLLSTTTMNQVCYVLKIKPYLTNQSYHESTITTRFF